MKAIQLGIILFSLAASVLSDTGECRREDCGCECCFVPLQNNCTRFCFCTSGKENSHELKCPENEVFDPFLAVCVSKDEFKCPDVPPSGFNCTGQRDGLYKHPKKCTAFVQCSNGYENVHNCGANLHFCDHCNPKRCEFPDIAKCQENIPCKHDGFYVNENDCSRYYHCATGQKVELTCPKGLEWCAHCVHPRCEYPHIANCVTKRQKPVNFNWEFSDSRNRVRVSSPLFRTSAYSMDEILNCTIPSGIYTVPSDSSLYLLCHGGRAAFYKCPSGQEFDQDTKSCVTLSLYTLLTSRQCHAFSEYLF